MSPLICLMTCNLVKRKITVFDARNCTSKNKLPLVDSKIIGKVRAIGRQRSCVVRYLSE
jgi:hypothetical protein